MTEDRNPEISRIIRRIQSKKIGIEKIRLGSNDLESNDFEKKPGENSLNSFILNADGSRYYNQEITHRESFYERESRRGTDLADMNQAKIVKARPEKRAAVGAFGLSGCTGIVVQFENPDNPSDKGAIVAHYDPMGIAIGIYETQLGTLLTDVAIQGMRSEALIVSPGIGNPESPTGFMPAESQSGHIQKLTGYIKKQLGQDTPVSKVGYSANSGDNTEQGSILVEFPKDQPPRLFIAGIPLRKPMS